MRLDRLALSLTLILVACDDTVATLDASAPGVDAAAPDAAAPPDAAPADAAAPDAAPPDAFVADAAPPDADVCVPIGSAGTAGSNPSLFGQISYFGGPDLVLPAGRYRISYVDGCMKYAPGQAWTVHAIGGSFAWWIGTARNDARVQPPGTTGHQLNNGGFADFADCVAANKLRPPVELDFAGGKLGVWLADSPFDDNVTGEDGRNPTWSIALADDGCP
jgi:hypothetical protein